MNSAVISQGPGISSTHLFSPALGTQLWRMSRQSCLLPMTTFRCANRCNG